MKQKKVCPYLLSNTIVDKPNQASFIDIIYSYEAWLFVFNCDNWMVWSLYRKLGNCTNSLDIV